MNRTANPGSERPRARREPGTAGSDPASLVDRYLAQWIEERPLPANLREAIRYAALGPGKRVRPTLVIRCCEAVGGRAEDALAAAAAIELIHAFSLVHDDLPAMDDDDVRRGRPALHRHTSEAMALLAGDAMLGLAVELVLARVDPARTGARLCHELIQGCNDMICGQVHDTLPGFDESVCAADRLETIHRLKTGALIRAACRMGAICGGTGRAELDAVTRFSEAIGLMFQVVDDLMDVTQTSDHLGKTAGKDASRQRLTYASLLGVEGSRREVERLRGEALQALEVLGRGGEPLRQLCEYLAVRTK
jgi:geranylgeranyl pyrophosphate synthase